MEVAIAEKEVARVRGIIKDVRLFVDSHEARDLLEMAKSYYSDSEHFLKTGKTIEAFEAAVIAWAYIDAGLRLEVFRVPDKHREHFTV